MIQSRSNNIVEIGMTRSEVVSILGKPDKIISFPDCSWCNPDEEILFYGGSFFRIIRNNITIVIKDDIVIRISEGHWYDK